MSIQNIIDSIGKDYPIQSISLTDYPTLNPFPQIIQGQVRKIANAISSLKEYVNNGTCDPIIKSLADCQINNSDELVNIIKGLNLSEKLKKEGVSTIGELESIDINTYTGDGRAQVSDAKVAIKKLIEVIKNVFKTIEDIWSLIQSVDGINFTVSNPTIKQIINYSSLLSGYTHIPQDKVFFSPQWDSLCTKIKTCICKDDDEKPQKWFVEIAFFVLFVVLVICFVTYCKGVEWERLLLAFVFMSSIASFSILAIYKFTQFLNMQCERNTKLKEKMIDKVINAFNEDRENAMLHTKTELFLHEKMVKTCIEEWERDKEYLRKLNILEHDRKAKLSDVLIELAKIQDKETTEDSQKKEKTIIKETSILQSLLDK